MWGRSSDSEQLVFVNSMKIHGFDYDVVPDILEYPYIERWFDAAEEFFRAEGGRALRRRVRWGRSQRLGPVSAYEMVGLRCPAQHLTPEVVFGVK